MLSAGFSESESYYGEYFDEEINVKIHTAMIEECGIYSNHGLYSAYSKAKYNIYFLRKKLGFRASILPVEFAGRDHN